MLTCILKLYKRRNYQKLLEISRKFLQCLELMGKYSAGRTKRKFDNFATKLRKRSCKTFHRKTYVTNLHGFFYNTLSKVVLGNTFSPLTRSRPHEIFILNIFQYFKGLIHYSNSYLGRLNHHKVLYLIYFKKCYFALQSQVHIWH